MEWRTPSDYYKLCYGHVAFFEVFEYSCVEWKEQRPAIISANSAQHRPTTFTTLFISVDLTIWSKCYGRIWYVEYDMCWMERTTPSNYQRRQLAPHDNIHYAILSNYQHRQRPPAPPDNIQFYSYWWIYQFGQMLFSWYVLNGLNNAQQLSAPPDNIQYAKLKQYLWIFNGLP